MCIRKTNQIIEQIIHTDTEPIPQQKRFFGKRNRNQSTRGF